MASSDLELQKAVLNLEANSQRNDAALDLLATVRARLGEGSIRVAEPDRPLDPTLLADALPRAWTVNTWVKTALLLMSRLGQPVGSASRENGAPGGIDLDTTPWLQTTVAGCRMPSGSFMREGAYLAPGSTCMPPTVLQIGCNIGPGAVLDSGVTIGLGAQIGAGAQLSAGAIVGGYILPLDRLPTIVENGVLMSSNTGVFDGAQIGQGAILLAGTLIVPSIGLYDLQKEAMVPLHEGVLRVPPGAIVGMGTRPVGSGGVQLTTALILGKRHGPHRKDWELYADIPLMTG